MTEKSRLIREVIAKGHSCEQILAQELAWTYHYIFEAAPEAPAVRNTSVPPAKVYAVEDIRSEHAQAYVKRDSVQDDKLRQLFRTGKSVAGIARLMQRQPGGIQSRLTKPGPVPRLVKGQS